MKKNKTIRVLVTAIGTVNGSTIISTLEYELEAINSKSAFATPAHELAKAVTTEVTDVVRTNKDQRAH